MARLRASAWTQQWPRAAVVLALALMLPASLHAQETGRIRGRITESGTDRPVNDVQVTIAGTSFGALTSTNGEYTISGVPTGTHTLSVRRIGYARVTRPVSVAAGAETRADFSIAVTASQLDAVVVTGTAGSAERRTVGNAVTTLDVSELTSKQSIANVSEVLQGKTPGVTILPGSGAPGTAGEIRIRGMGSLSGYRPVVFIDGIRYNIEDLGGFSATGGGTIGLAQSSQVTSALNNLNPNDIESIEVIKGPAAATLYGAEAANGVIQIITKKGRRGQQAMRWSFRGEQGRSDWNLIPDDNYTTCDAAKQAATVSATDLRPLWPGCQGVPVNTVIRYNPLRDWRDPSGLGAIRDGAYAKASMSVSGGGDRYSFYVSGDRDTEQGVFHNSDQARTSIRANFGFNPNDVSDFQLTVNYIDSDLRLPIQDESANGLLLSARRGQAGRRSFFTDTTAFGWRTITPGQSNRYKNFTGSERVTLGATVNYNPFRWLRNRATLGFDNTYTQAQLLFLPGDVDVSQDPEAGIGANLRRTPVRRMLTLDYAGTVPWDLTPDVVSTTTFGSQVVADRSDMIGATGVGIGAVDVTRIDLLQTTRGSELFSENNSVGFFLQEQVGWKNRLFVTGAMRADDHSSFGSNFDMIIYPKFSASYVASEEPALAPYLDRTGINSLRVRGAWGQAGRAPSAYSAPQTYTVDRVTLGVNTGSALRTNAYGNPDLKPEKGTELELGFDLGALQDRIGVDFTFYSKRTSDMLQSVTVAPSTGFISTQLQNLGEVTNRGFEVSAFGTPVQHPRVVWETRLNFATNRNRLESFGIAGKEVENPAGQAYGVVQQHRVGYPLGGYWVASPLRCGDAIPTLTGGAVAQPCLVDGAAVVTTTGVALFPCVAPMPTCTTPQSDAMRRYIGPSTPTREIGFSNTFTLFTSFRVYALLDYKGGHYLFNMQERNRCQAANDNCARVNDPRARFAANAQDSASVIFRETAVYRSTAISPEWIQPADFIKLRELSLTYDLPQGIAAKAGAAAASLVLSGRNLAIWSDYEGVDPEVNSYGGRNFVRVDAYAAPQMRRIGAAINLTY